MLLMRGEIGHALVIDPVPELLGAERLLADRRHLGRQLLARQPDQIAPAIRQHIAGRREQRRFGEDPLALGGGQFAHGHAFVIAL